MKKKTIFLKNKIINELLISGKKEKSEKILSKSFKLFQKLNKKSLLVSFQFSIINAAPVFDINSQIVKKGKRKNIKETPIFLSNSKIRSKNSFKFLKKSSIKEKKKLQFYKSFVKEISNSMTLNGTSKLSKIEKQKQVLLNKRYWYNFKW